MVHVIMGSLQIKSWAVSSTHAQYYCTLALDRAFNSSHPSSCRSPVHTLVSGNNKRRVQYVTFGP